MTLNHCVCVEQLNSGGYRSLLHCKSYHSRLSTTRDGGTENTGWKNVYKFVGAGMFMFSNHIICIGLNLA